jgi:YesN/AraC family two-component response regulator
MTDVIMPEMNGRELAKSLLSLYPHLKCLFMSGYTDDIIASHNVLAPGTCFLQKPFSIKKLSAALTKLKQSD